MVAAGGNFMRKTPQESYDLIENITQHHVVGRRNRNLDLPFEWPLVPSSLDHVVVSLSHSLNPTGNSDSILEDTDKLLPHHDLTILELNNEIFDPEGDILILRNLLKDDPSEAKNSEIDSLIEGPSDTFLMGDEDIKLNPPMDVDNLVPIPRVSEKPLDSLDPILKLPSIRTLSMEIAVHESEMETIMDEVQINSTQTTAQITPLYGKFSIDITIPNPIMSLS
ncbi:hypothetical protein Tco_0678269 [Tanacetum coccineum]|uniref:Reverse transcriptase domain-containing protein n=1 Tax=Tanacetum coccineum TaxID=301880 RepID=A0ABQ4XEJ8_9ASTR